MNTIKNYKLDLAASPNSLNKELSVIKITKDETKATNSHILAVIPTIQLFTQDFIDSMPEDGFYISAPEYKKLSKLTKLTFKDKTTIIGNSKQGDELISIIEANKINYPSYDSVLPPYDTNESKEFLKINHKLLEKLCKAIGADDSGIKIESRTKNRIIVKSNNAENKAIGLLMCIL